MKKPKRETATNATTLSPSPGYWSVTEYEHGREPRVMKLGPYALDGEQARWLASKMVENGRPCIIRNPLGIVVLRYLGL